jgi:hypothetical protein
VKFYVYEHWRPDTDLCFYVGKGQGRRAYKFRRNEHYDRVIDKLASLGMCAEIRLVANGLSEDHAFRIEKDRIAFWRSVGVILTNMTDGGEGLSGFVRPLGIPLSVEARAKLSTARKGIKFSDEHRAKLTARKIGVPRKPFTEETIKKMRVAALERERLKRDIYGDKVRRDSRVVGVAVKVS